MGAKSRKNQWGVVRTFMGAISEEPRQPDCRVAAVVIGSRPPQAKAVVYAAEVLGKIFLELRARGTNA